MSPENPYKILQFFPEFVLRNLPKDQSEISLVTYSNISPDFFPGFAITNYRKKFFFWSSSRILFHKMCHRKSCINCFKISVVFFSEIYPIFFLKLFRRYLHKISQGFLQKCIHSGYQQVFQKFFFLKWQKFLLNFLLVCHWKIFEGLIKNLLQEFFQKKNPGISSDNLLGILSINLSRIHSKTSKDSFI